MGLILYVQLPIMTEYADIVNVIFIYFLFLGNRVAKECLPTFGDGGVLFILASSIIFTCRYNCLGIQLEEYP